MKITIIFLSLFLLFACGPSEEEKQNTAIITCNVMGESRNMDASIRIKEINLARDKINEEPYLYGDDKIKESFKYGICTNLVLNDPEYENILYELKEKEKAIERKKREAARLKKQKEEEAARLKKQKEEEAAELKKQQLEEAKKLPRKEWRKVMLEHAKVPEITKVRARVSKNYSKYIEIQVYATCQKGVKTKLRVRFKSILPEFESNNSIGYCSGSTYDFVKMFNREDEEDRKIMDQIDLLPTTNTSKSYEYKDLNMFIIQDVDVEIYGAWKPDIKAIDPRNFPPLETSETLDEPIYMKAKFSRWFEKYKE